MKTYNQTFGSFIDALDKRVDKSQLEDMEADELPVELCRSCKKWFKQEEEYVHNGRCVDCGSDDFCQ